MNAQHRGGRLETCAREGSVLFSNIHFRFEVYHKTSRHSGGDQRRVQRPAGGLLPQS